MFLLGAFLTGGAVTYAADRTWSGNHPHGRAYTEKSMRDELQQKLRLNAAQRAAMDSAFDWRRTRYDEIMTPIRPQLDAMRDTTRQRFMISLDSTQKVAYTAIVDEMRRKADTSRRGSGGSPR
jgi:hypothetical protein